MIQHADGVVRTADHASRASTGCIYVLISGDELRYVGLTTQTPEERMWEHQYTAQSSRRHLYRWMRSVNLDVQMVVIAHIPNSDLDEAEKQWIKLFKDLGCRLTNKTSGGRSYLGKTHRLPSQRATCIFCRRLMSKKQIDVGCGCRRRMTFPAPASCVQCRSSFESSIQLKAHRRTQHGQRTAESKGRYRDAALRRVLDDKPCPLCDRICVGAPALGNHLSRSHGVKADR